MVYNNWPFPNDWVSREIITDPVQLERIKFMFQEYTLDEALEYSITPNHESVTFVRNGSIYKLEYLNDKLQRVIIEPV